MKDTLVKITLSGGPAELATRDHSIPMDELDRPLKISYLSGYEHFVLDDENPAAGEGGTVVFRWSHRTKIAE